MIISGFVIQERFILSTFQIKKVVLVRYFRLYNIIVGLNKLLKAKGESGFGLGYYLNCQSACLSYKSLFFIEIVGIFIISIGRESDLI